MGIFDVFGAAGKLWVRCLGWLVLANVVAGLAMGLLRWVVSLITNALVSNAVEQTLSSGSSIGVMSFLGGGAGLLGILVSLVGSLVIAAVGSIFFGSMQRMVIAAWREDRGVHLQDLFSGFRRFGSFVLYALVLWGIGILLTPLMFIPILGWLAAAVFWIWLMVTWLYVLPLMADRDIGFVEAARRSKGMVDGSGWWWTFLVLLVFALTFGGLYVLCQFVIGTVALSGTGSIVASVLLFVVVGGVVGVLFGSYGTCVLATMYLAVSGDAPAKTVPQNAPLGTAYPAAYAQGDPASGGQFAAMYSPETVASAAPVSSGAALGAGTAADPAGLAPGAPAPPDANAWRAAADPLAGQPPRPEPSTAPSAAAPAAAPAAAADAVSPSAPEAPPSGAPDAASPSVPDAPPSGAPDAPPEGGPAPPPAPPSPGPPPPPSLRRPST